MAETLDHDRRRFLGTVAMTMATARFGIFAATESQGRESRELVAIGRATEWLNSPRLTAAAAAVAAALKGGLTTITTPAVIILTGRNVSTKVISKHLGAD